MQYPSFFLATRLLRHIPLRGTLGLLLRIAAISIAIAAGSFVVVGAIMNGFHTATVRALQGVRAPCTLMAPRGRAIDSDAAIRQLSQHVGNRIAAFLPRCEFPVLIKNPSGDIDITEPLLCMAIDPVREYEGKILTRYIADPEILLTLNGPRIIMGARRLASENTSIGDTVTLAYPDEEGGKDALKTIECSVIGTVNTGLYELDERLVLMHHELLSELPSIEWPHELGIVPRDLSDAESLCRACEAVSAPLRAASWQSLYPSLAAALTLEYTAMGAILLLMCGLAALTIAALMLVVVREQRPLIAMLAACGVAREIIVRALTLVGVMLVVVSGGIGVAFGAGIAFALDYYALIPLPDVYYAAHLPATITPLLLIVTMGMITLVGWCATYIPARRAYHISCAAVLREEF